VGIIKSLLDTDSYKFTMGQAVYHTQPEAVVKYKFNCRNKGVKLGYLLNEINCQLDSLCKLQFSKTELVQLKNKMPYLKDDFLEFLRLLKLNRKYINAENVDGELKIYIEGPWMYTIWFEVPVLAIVNELYFLSLGRDSETQINHFGVPRLNEKLEKIIYVDGFTFADFGTRRRYSFEWHDKLIGKTLEFFNKEGRANEFFVGTSNVYFAIKYNIKSIGTMAHEWFQGHQQARGVSLFDFQKSALERWSQEYRGLLGIALSDIIGFDAFLRDFDLHFSKLFDGCRHDSGDPVEWCEKLINHYVCMNIDPRTKTAIFSDGLDFPKAMKLFGMFKNRIKMSFGIGTNFTNDVGEMPLQIVIKMVEQNGRPTAKISDSPGKGMCEDPWFEDMLKRMFKLEI
jgi:nicotinate phosphoribosyltransferase